MRKINPRGVILVSTALLLSACNDPVNGYFAPVARAQPSATPTAVEPQPVISPVTSPSPMPSPSQSGITLTLQTLKPALSVRGIGCLMCHARATSDVITDFGYGSPFYTGNDLGSFEAQYYYGNHYLGWQDHPAQSQGDADYTLDSQGNPSFIKGTVHVPRVAVGQAQGNTNLTLKDFLLAPDSTDNAVVPDPNNPKVTNAHEPWVNPRKFQPSNGVYVQDWNTVYIGDLTSSQILGLDPSLQNLSDAQWVRITKNDPASASKPAVSGLVSVTGANNVQYVSNVSNAPFVCYGDVVVNGTLFLQDSNIVTDDSGCRLYVTKSVFIRGPINISNSVGSSLQNVQITSARSVVMGMSPTVFANRFNTSHDPNDQYELALRNYPDENSAVAFVGEISTEMNGIGPSLLLDAQDPGSIAEYGYASGMDGSQIAVVNYDHLLLNAPLVESRYLGQFQGSVIAEIAMFSLGDLNFSYDPVFSQVNAFPLIPDTSVILNVSN